MYHSSVSAKINARIVAELKPIDMEAYTRDLLDEIEPEVVICGMTYSPSTVLESVDPIAFQCMVSDNFDSDSMFEGADGEYYWQNDVDTIIEEETDTKI